MHCTEMKNYWDTFYGPNGIYCLENILVSSNTFRVDLLILDHCEGLVVCNSIYWHADRRLLLGQCWGYAGSTQNTNYCHGRQYHLWHWFQSLPRKSNIFCYAFFQRSRVERTEPLKVLSPSPPLLPGVVRGQPLSPPGQFIDAPSPECPQSLCKVSPLSLPRKTGLKGGVPFSPLDLTSQIVPVPLPFITNHFFPGSPETIDSFLLLN